jgi:hypothetical protein
MVDFGHVMIFGRQPENGYGFDSFSGKFPSDADGRERFVDGKSRAGKKSHLLTCYYRDNARFREDFKGRMAGIQRAKRID